MTQDSLAANGDASPLDPADDGEWEEISNLGHRIIDDLVGLLSGIRAEPAWQAVPESVVQALDIPPPETGAGAEAAYHAFLRLVLPYRLGNIHPHFWGRVMGTGTAAGMLAEALTGGININASGLAGSASHVEACVIRWCRELLALEPPDASGLPSNAPSAAGGILVSGGSMANFVCMAAMRAEAARRHAPAFRERGMHAFERHPVVYCSAETHVSVQRALTLLGLGRDALRHVACDEDGRIDVDALERAIRRDRGVGTLPICIVGTAGTVNTGAIDDLPALQEIATRERLWFHVDGAFGAWAALADNLTSDQRTGLSGMRYADSVAVDLHKWLSVPYGVACALIRNAAAHLDAFAGPAAYLSPASRGAEADPYRFNEWGPELSREFRALKAWYSILAHGVGAYRQAIARNIRYARALAHRVVSDPGLELLAPSAPGRVLNIVVLRFTDPGLSSEQHDRVNAEILMRLHERAIAVPTTGRVAGRRGLRVAVVNHRSQMRDFEMLADAVVRLGREVLEEGTTEG